jgi:uncharacterized protein
MKPYPDRPPADSGAKGSGAPNIAVRKRFNRWLVLITGWSFVALGVVGLFLPILQGVLFLLIGVTILSTEYVWAHKLLQKLRKRFPSLTARLDTAQWRAHAWLKRIFSPKSGGV